MRRALHLMPPTAAQGEERVGRRDIAWIAERNEGIVTRAQLRELELSRHEIAHLVGIRHLHVVHRGVYVVGHRKLTQRGQWLAAVAALGEGAKLSRRAAAAHWGMLPAVRGDIDVSSPKHKKKQRGIRPHWEKLERDEWRIKDGIPVTTPERTLLDLAATHPKLLDRAIREAHYLRLVSPASLARFCKRHEGRSGSKALRKAIEQADLDQGPTHEELERRFRRFLKKHKLPLPKFNQPLQIDGHAFTPDCIWHDHRLILELDSRQAHATPHAFEEDRARDRVFQVAGYRVIRITWRQLHDEPEALLMDLSRFLVDPVNARR